MDFFDENFIGRWAAGQLTDEEKKFFEIWLSQNQEHQKYFSDLHKIWSQETTIPEIYSQEERWLKLRTIPRGP